MKILITGANGFLGASITAKLLQNNHEVICAVRDSAATQLKFPSTKIVHCDFNTLDSTGSREKLLENLNNIDIVINVAGVLESSGANKIDNVHVAGPIALFDMCVKAGVKRIIHISALGIENENTTPYAVTKKQADSYLQTLSSIDWVILQPSLVYASGAYGGTVLFRALAALPYIIPLVGDGSQQFQPVHIDDLTEIVLYCVNREGDIKRTLKVVGPDVITIKALLMNFRRWLGLKPAKLIKVPLSLVKIGAKIGDLGIGPLNSTMYKMMQQPNIADKEALIKFTGIVPRSFEKGLVTEPLTIQSLWQARLFFLKPLIKWGLGLFWIASGVISSVIAPELAFDTIEELDISDNMAPIILYTGCLLDIILGLLLLIKKKIARVCLAQIIVILGYTVILTVLHSDVWLDPLGCVLKNIPIILLILVLMAIERDK